MVRGIIEIGIEIGICFMKIICNHILYLIIVTICYFYLIKLFNC
jgi:hypothetical protein